MNLVLDKWIPISSKGGELYQIAPWEISVMAKPGTYLNFPRADFNMTILMFLVGVFQIIQKAMGPLNIKKVPSDQSIKKILAFYKDAFELFSLKTPFMQDRSVIQRDSSSIFSLLLDGPKDNTIKNKRDFFRKEGVVKTLCPSCSAAGLYTLQMFAYQGGCSYFTSPLFNRLLCFNTGSSLLETVLNNTLPPEAMKKYGTGKAQNLFPWTCPSQERRTLSPSDFPAEHVYWLTPWRFLLIPENRKGICDCCGEETSVVVSEVKKFNNGIQYRDVEHPLYVYRIVGKKEKKKIPESVCTKEGNANLRKLSHLYYGEVLSNPEKYQVPAIVSQELMFCGIAMTKSYVGLVEGPVHYRKDLQEKIKDMVEFEKEASDNFYRPEHDFETEALRTEFETLLEGTFQELIRDNPADILEQWYKVVAQTCVLVYDRHRKGRRWLINKMCESLEEKGIAEPEKLFTTLKWVRKEHGRLSSEQCSIIMRWWSWLNQWGKNYRYEQQEVPYKNFVEREIYRDHSIYRKLEHTFGEDCEDQTFRDRFSLAAYLVLNFLKRNTNTSFGEAVKKAGLKLDDHEALIRLVKSERDFNVLSVFNTLLYS